MVKSLISGVSLRPESESYLSDVMGRWLQTHRAGQVVRKLRENRVVSWSVFTKTLQVHIMRELQ